jgi:hypothetical protein
VKQLTDPRPRFSETQPTLNSSGDEHLARIADAASCLACLPTFLLTVLGRGQKVDLTQAKRNKLRKELPVSRRTTAEE